MKLSKKEISNFGKVYTLSKIVFIVFNDKFYIEHINVYAKKILNLKKESNVIGQSIFDVFQQINVQVPINRKFKLVQDFILIKNHFLRWEKISILVGNDKWYFLLGQNIDWEHSCHDYIKGQLNPASSIENEEFYLNNIIESLPQLVYWKDKNYLYQGCNKHVADLLKLNSPRAIIGKSDNDFGWDKDRIENLHKVDQLIIEKGISSIVEDPIPDNGITKILLTSKTPLRNKNNEIVGILGISTDITERKHMEQELYNAKEAAEAATRAKTAFIANMSHDIRTPLTGVIGMSEMLKEQLNNPELKQEAILLAESGNQLLTMLNEILEDVRAENFNESDIQEETFDVHECIHDLIKLEAPTTISKHLGLECLIDSNVPQYIVSDRKKIHHILLNLLGNAVKFTQKGKVTIEVKCLDMTESHAHIQINVSDTGIGIPDGLHNKVFERFFRIDPSYKGRYEGHGLGLHIVQSYVNLLGGHVTLTSKEGVGTTCHFDLQCKIGKKEFSEDIKVNEAEKKIDIVSEQSQVSNPTLASSSSPLCSVNENMPHFLLVEDNAIALKVLESMITHAGCRFTSAMDAETALELLKSSSFDLVVTDIGLPGMSGIELAHQIRAFEKNTRINSIPIIGLTGHAQSIKPECIMAGMNDVLSKPLQASTLQLLLKPFISSSNRELSLNSENRDSTMTSGGQLGSDLPDTEEGLFELSVFSIFAPDEGMKEIGDNLPLLIDMLKMFISEAIQQDIKQIEQAYLKKDWEKMEKLAHKVKGGVLSLGLIRMRYACQYFERYYKAGHRNILILDKLYRQLIAVNSETINEINMWLGKYKINS